MSTTLLASLLIRKLERFEPWSVDERQSVLDAIDSTLRLPAHAHLVQEGEIPDGIHVVLEGFACGYKLLPDGRRQIVSYCVPGDVCDLRITLLPRMDCSIGTISQALVVRLSRERLQHLTVHSPRLARAFWQTALVDQAISREWLINVGQRTAFSARPIFCARCSCACGRWDWCRRTRASSPLRRRKLQIPLRCLPFMSTGL